MKSISVITVFLLCVYKYEVLSLKLPGPMVYVVTPSPRPPKSDGGRSAPFYYHTWKRRMDQPRNVSLTTTTVVPKSKTPDLIFAEFQSDHKNMKSIQKLLEKERVEIKTTTTTTTSHPSQPIYVPDEDTDDVTRVLNYGLPFKTEKKVEVKPDESKTMDYFAMYNKLYNSSPASVYLSSITPITTTTITTPSTTIATTNTTPLHMNVENIWHVIDNEKYDQYSDKWEEEKIESENASNSDGNKPEVNEEDKNIDDELGPSDDNFALPGFGTNPGNGAENESRAIRTEPNIRFPYINLKPFKMKSVNKHLQSGISNSKKTTNLMMSLDNFREIKHPVRGEAQDIGPVLTPTRQPIDRYNPAQPYLPQPNYGSKYKAPSPTPSFSKAVSNLVPPPPPPLPPKLTDDDFPAPTNYESFPPYAPDAPVSNAAPVPPPPPPPKVEDNDFPIPTNYESFPPYAPSVPTLNPAPPPPAPKPQPAITVYQPPADMSESSKDSGLQPTKLDDDDQPKNTGYQYRQPSSSVNFLPTVPPLQKPFPGYSYAKPSMTYDQSPPMDAKPDFQGYHYNKPEVAPELDHPSISYGDDSHSHHHDDSDYPELLFDNHHGMGGANKPGNDYNDSDMGMAPPPPPPSDTKPDHEPSMNDSPTMDNHGFPHDFPGDLKFHHDFEDDHDHHYHYHTTTTTTTEMPRVNRYSYYYLGKKLYYLPLYFSVYFIVYVGALIIKAVLRHKIVYPNSWRPNDMTASFFSKRSVDAWDLHEITGKVTHAIATAAERFKNENKNYN